MSIIKKYYIVSSIYNIGLAFFGGTLYLLMQQHGYSASNINLFLITFWIVAFFFEMPSGIFADAFGARKTIIVSGILRIVGLGILLFNFSAISILIISAILTGISDTLKSSTLEAWVANEIQKNKLDIFFANSSKVNTVINLLGGFFGAQVLGKIDYAYPVIASIVLFALAILVSMFVLPRKPLEPDGVYNGAKKINLKFSAYKTTLKNGADELKKNYQFHWIVLAFVPSIILVTQPFNQWQLYFNESKFGNNYLMGWILLGINISAIFGARLSQILSKKFGKTFKMISIILLVNFGFICIVAMTKNIYIAIFAFLVHSMITSSQEIIQSTMLNGQLNNEARTMMLSIFNTVESLITVIVLGVDSLLIHVMDIGTAWIILGAISILIAIPVFYRLSCNVREYG